jgi:hypothetical protein
VVGVLSEFHRRAITALTLRLRKKNAGRNQAQVLVTPDLSPSIVPMAIGPSADVVLAGAMIVAT